MPARGGARPEAPEAARAEPFVSHGEPGGAPSLLISSSRPATGAADGHAVIVNDITLHRLAAFIRKALLSVRLDQRSVDAAIGRGEVFGLGLGASTIPQHAHLVPAA